MENSDVIPAVIGWTERATPPTMVDKIIIIAVYLAKQVRRRTSEKNIVMIG